MRQTKAMTSKAVRKRLPKAEKQAHLLARDSDLIEVIWPLLDAGLTRKDIEHYIANVFDSWGPGVSWKERGSQKGSGQQIVKAAN